MLKLQPLVSIITSYSSWPIFLLVKYISGRFFHVSIPAQCIRERNSKIGDELYCLVSTRSARRCVQSMAIFVHSCFLCRLCYMYVRIDVPFLTSWFINCALENAKNGRVYKKCSHFMKSVVNGAVKQDFMIICTNNQLISISWGLLKLVRTTLSYTTKHALAYQCIE